MGASDALTTMPADMPLACSSQPTARLPLLPPLLRPGIGGDMTRRSSAEVGSPTTWLVAGGIAFCLALFLLPRASTADAHSLSAAPSTCPVDCNAQSGWGKCEGTRCVCKLGRGGPGEGQSRREKLTRLLSTSPALGSALRLHCPLMHIYGTPPPHTHTRTHARTHARAHNPHNKRRKRAALAEGTTPTPPTPPTSLRLFILLHLRQDPGLRSEGGPWAAGMWGDGVGGGEAVTRASCNAKGGAVPRSDDAGPCPRVRRKSNAAASDQATGAGRSVEAGRWLGQRQVVLLLLLMMMAGAVAEPEPCGGGIQPGSQTPPPLCACAPCLAGPSPACSRSTSQAGPRQLRRTTST